MIKNKMFFLSGSLVFLSLFLPLSAIALEINNYPYFLGHTITPSSSFADFAAYFFNFGMAIAGILAVLVIVFGGIFYLISLGIGKFTNEGLEWVKSGVVGLVILLSAYLMAYTINPALVYFNITDLVKVGLLGPFNPSPPGGSVPIVNYNEIPIGNLTDTLLSRKMDCYDFNYDGDPIQGDDVQTDNMGVIKGPTYLLHDRPDCFLKLTEAAEKKAKIVNDLSDKITSLMNQCSCAPKKVFIDFIDPANPESNPDCYGQLKNVVKLNNADISISSGFSAPFIKSMMAATNIWNSAASKNIFGKISIGKTSTNDPLNIGPDLISNGKSEITMLKPDNILQGLFDEENPDWIARTYQQGNGEFDIFINSKIKFGDATKNPNVHDFQSLIAHELGHALGLDDVYDEKCRKQSPIMFGLESRGNVSRDLGSADIKGLKSLYSKEAGGVECPAGECPNPNPKILSCSPEYCNQGGGSNSVFDCKTNCAKDGKDCLYPKSGKCPIDKKYIGSVDPCKDTCSKSAGCSCQANCQVCPEGTKDKIEHGPIKIADCDGEGKEYRGLDEFRCPIPNNNPQCSGLSSVCSNIAGSIEKQVQIDKKTVTIIDIDKWNCLNLIQQLTYLKEKMEELRAKIQADLKKLDEGRAKLADCYTVKSSVDFFKLVEKTKKDEKLILPVKTFTDPETNQLADSSKYCKGFVYAGSSCLHLCSNLCPEYSPPVIDCYKQCPQCQDNNNQNTQAYQDCLAKQTKCMQACFNKRKCIFSDKFDTMDECIVGCRDNCSEFCSKKFLKCSDEYQKCISDCQGDSKCVLDNASNCLIDFQQTKKCADSYSDEDNLKYCTNKALLCKNCSYQYAGYPDCLKDCEFATHQNWYDSCINADYSSSFLYQNPSSQKCLRPDQAVATVSSGGGNYIITNCINKFPETAKCPTSSKCPDCPCATVVDQTAGSSSSDGNTAYRVCGGECAEYAYRADPLNFYCRTSFEEESSVLGTVSDRSKNYEVPVGQSVDSARQWAKNMMALIDNFVKETGDMISYMKKIGEEKNYCKCESKCDTAGKEPTCKAKCVFQQTEAYVDPKDSKNNKPAVCSCARQGCSGNPCQKIINMLLGKSAKDRCPKGIAFKGIPAYYNDIYNALSAVKKFLSPDQRTDVVKELTYSRNQMDNCSTGVVGSNQELVKAVSCTRAYPGTGFFNTICYGIEYGKTMGLDLTDNWFCFGRITR